MNSHVTQMPSMYPGGGITLGLGAAPGSTPASDFASYGTWVAKHLICRVGLVLNSQCKFASLAERLPGVKRGATPRSHLCTIWPLVHTPLYHRWRINAADSTSWDVGTIWLANRRCVALQALAVRCLCFGRIIPWPGHVFVGAVVSKECNHAVEVVDFCLGRT